LKRRSPDSGPGRSRLSRFQPSPTLTTGVARKSGLEKSPGLQGRVRAATTPQHRPHNAPQTPFLDKGWRTTPPERAREVEEKLWSLSDKEDNLKRVEASISNKPAGGSRRRSALHWLGSGRTKRMWRWTLTRPLKVSILDGAETCRLSYSSLDQRMSRGL
jgi:hypothetical protein